MYPLTIFDEDKKGFLFDQTYRITNSWLIRWRKVFVSETRVIKVTVSIIIVTILTNQE